MDQTPEDPQPGQEVAADDAGVPNDPPGPDVPEDHGSTESPDVPTEPGTEQPEGTKDVDGADPGEPAGGDDEGDEDLGGDDKSSTASDDGPDAPEGDDRTEEEKDAAKNIGMTTKPAEPA